MIVFRTDQLPPPDPEVHLVPPRTEPDATQGQTFFADGSSSGGAKRKHGRRILVLGSVLVVSVVALVYYVWRILPYESTDDAFIEGHVTQIAPQVAGRVCEVLVRDNQFVQAGEVLVPIEVSDYEAKLEQARFNFALGYIFFLRSAQMARWQVPGPTSQVKFIAQRLKAPTQMQHGIR